MKRWCGKCLEYQSWIKDGIIKGKQRYKCTGIGCGTTTILDINNLDVRHADIKHEVRAIYNKYLSSAEKTILAFSNTYNGFPSYPKSTLSKHFLLIDPLYRQKKKLCSAIIKQLPFVAPSVKNTLFFKGDDQNIALCTRPRKGNDYKVLYSFQNFVHVEDRLQYDLYKNDDLIFHQLLFPGTGLNNLDGDILDSEVREFTKQLDRKSKNPQV